MGMIEYAACKKLDINGNKVYYYRFLANSGREYTDKFQFLGRRTTHNKRKVIRSGLSPSELIEWFHTDYRVRQYVSQELVRAQLIIDRCNGGKGCGKKCRQSDIDTCSMIERHARLVAESNEVDNIISSSVMRAME